MLGDRDYMRPDWQARHGHARHFAFRLAFSATTTLIIANVVLFFLQQFGLTEWLVFSVPAVLHGQVWRIVTHMFAHAGFEHIFWNMFGLFMFGRVVEDVLGTRRFYVLYFLSGLVGLAGWVLFNFTQPAVLLGASGALFGVMAAAAVLHPTMVVYVFFVLPLQMRTFVLLYAGLSVAMELWGLGHGVAHLAHLGGMLGGYVYVRRAMARPATGVDWLGPLRRLLRRRRGFRVHPGTDRPDPRPPASPFFVPDDHEADDDRMPPLDGDPLTQIDPILDKIGKHGMASLTPRERAMLDRAREKLRGERT